MSVWGIARVKDEADVITATVERMAAQVDQLLISDNASTDGTRDILTLLARKYPLQVIDDPEVGYYQAQKMSELAAYAAAEGADWVIPFDADEVWYSPFGRIADVLSCQPDAAIAGAELYDHVPTAEDPADGDPVARIGWRRRTAAPLAKVAARPRPPVRIHQGNHGADHGTRVDGLLVVRHFPYRSPEQMISKARNGAAAYAATDLPEDIGKHWRDYGRLTDEQIADVFRRYFWSPAPAADPGLIYDPAPACA
jgi:glycosyltransferase involved in cell wall biosynthesis